MMVFDRIFGKLEEKIFEPVRWAVSFFCVNVLWLLFRSDSIGQWKQIIKTIAQFNSTSISEDLLNSFVLPEAGFLTDVLHIGRLTNGIHGFWMLSFVLAPCYSALFLKTIIRNGCRILVLRCCWRQLPLSGALSA